MACRKKKGSQPRVFVVTLNAVESHTNVISLGEDGLDESANKAKIVKFFYFYNLL